MQEGQTVDPTTSNQILDSSGDDLTYDYDGSTDSGVPIENDNAYTTASADLSNNDGDIQGEAKIPGEPIADDVTGTPTDQSYDIASAKHPAELPENPMGLPAKSWANAKNIVLKVRSGKLDFAFFQLDLQNKDIVVSKTREHSLESPMDDFIDGLKEQEIGYALYHITGQIIPVFFNLSDVDMNNETLKKIMAVFTLFNISLGLGGVEMEKIFDQNSFKQFLARVIYGKHI